LKWRIQTGASVASDGPGDNKDASADGGTNAKEDEIEQAEATDEGISGITRDEDGVKWRIYRFGPES
jgi:hypothetical protein